MNHRIYFSVLASWAALFLLFGLSQIAPLEAQEIRPTPTNEGGGATTPPPGETVTPIPPTATPEPGTSPTSANPADGSIRGTLYEDKNGDGQCSATDPVLAGIPIQFVSNDGQTTVYLQSGDNGTYGLVGAGYGTWQVSADPPAPWVVTSAKTVQAFVGSEQKVALNINFCLANIENIRSNVVLPVSGTAASNTPFFLAAVVGLGLLFVGLSLRRRAHS
jgi:hypothetical protein